MYLTMYKIYGTKNYFCVVVLLRYNEIGCYAIVLMMNIFYRQLFIVIANY